ncbi:MAG: ADP-ribosylglycohydrolase family protein, partial [Bacteroidota bacterium]
MRFISLLCLFLSLACTTAKKQPTVVCLDAQGQAILYTPQAQDLEIDRGAYQDQLYGFWLAQCIANWTGLITEMDKIGNIGEIQTGAFYTREDWGTADLPNIWSGDAPSKVSDTIDFV